MFSKSLTIVALAATAQTTMAIKCYTTNPTDWSAAPIKYDVDVPGSQVCLRYKFTCTQAALTVDASCKGAKAGDTRLVYLPNTQATADQMKGMSTVYQDLFVCSMEYCNYTPSASGAGDTVSSPALIATLITVLGLLFA